MIDHSKPGGSVMLVAVNFRTEPIAVSKAMTFRVGSGRQHRLGCFGWRSPESEPRNLHFVSGLAAVVYAVAVGYFDDSKGIVLGVQDDDVRSVSQTGSRLAWGNSDSTQAAQGGITHR